MATELRDWLDISTDGFAQRQVDRMPAHLAKEVVQNALDSIDGVSNGVVEISVQSGSNGVLFSVEDNGPGVDDPRVLRTVFSTGKEDSVLLRGRMGQGFKEILCLSTETVVRSKGNRIHFTRNKAGERITKIEPLNVALPGTKVDMIMPWEASAVSDLVAYFRTFIVPKGCTMRVNGQPVMNKLIWREVDVLVTTEMFAGDRWKRAKQAGRLQIIPAEFGEEGKIFEMGIPICSMEWPERFHVNVLMRVPMNPRRDAVASGYLKEIYKAVLPHLIDQLVPEQLRNEWVSEALPGADQDLTRDVVIRAFGANAVRSVPTMGGADYDADARELGRTTINTSHLPAGMREAVRAILPTSRDVEMDHRRAMGNLSLQSAETDEREERVKSFITYILTQVLGMPVKISVVPEITFFDSDSAVSWAPGGRIFLAQRHRSKWNDPFEPATLGLLVWAAAHEIHPHHGDGFKSAQEVVSGRLARLFFDRAEAIRSLFHDLIPKGIAEVPTRPINDQDSAA